MTPSHPLESLSRGSGQQYSAKKKPIYSKSRYAGLIHIFCDIVDLVIFASLNFREFVILGLFMKFKIRELSISMIVSAYNNNFRVVLIFLNLSSSQNSQKLKPHKYYQIYSMTLE